MMLPPKRLLLRRRLMMATALSLAAFGASEGINRARPLPDYQVRIAAATLVSRAEELIRGEKVRRGIAVSQQDDPAGSGLIGPKFSPIVTDGSALEVKRTATNPNLAAAVVAMLSELGVTAGDHVAILMTGSLPGANLAALAAVQSLGAKPTIIASVGPSMWGATDPAFTWLDMASLVDAAGLLRARPLAATAGGQADDARGLDPGARALMQQAATRNRIPFFVPRNLAEAAQFRIKSLARAQGGLPKVMINVGGGAASYGVAFNSVNAPASIIAPEFASRLQPTGVIYYMLDKGISVVNLHQITETARSYGLPVDLTGPAPVGAPEGLYYAKSRPRLPLVLLLAALLLGLGLILRMGGVVPVDEARREPVSRVPRPGGDQ